jgi:hypothetical protein
MYELRTEQTLRTQLTRILQLRCGTSARAAPGPRHASQLRNNWLETMPAEISEAGDAALARPLRGTGRHPNRTPEVSDAEPAPLLRGTIGKPPTPTLPTIVASHAATLRETTRDHSKTSELSAPGLLRYEQISLRRRTESDKNWNYDEKRTTTICFSRTLWPTVSNGPSGRPSPTSPHWTITCSRSRTPPGSEQDADTQDKKSHQRQGGGQQEPSGRRDRTQSRTR